MFDYIKMTSFPVNLKHKDLKFAKALYAQFGGPNGELNACLRYFAQSFTMPDERGKRLLKDIATEEMGHVEMICTMIYQLTRNATPKELEDAGLGCAYVIHGDGLGLQDCAGVPYTTAGVGVTADYRTDLVEDMAAEEKARSNYEHLINLTDDQECIAILLFLRQREIVHYNRFKEMLETYNKEFKR